MLGARHAEFGLSVVGDSSLRVVVPDSGGYATYVVLTALRAFTSQDGNQRDFTSSKATPLCLQWLTVCGAVGPALEGVGRRVNEFYSLFQRVSFFAPTTTTEMSQRRADLGFVQNTMSLVCLL